MVRTWIVVGIMCIALTPVWAEEAPTPSEVPASSVSTEGSPLPPSLLEQKAERELKELKTRPEEYRVLVLGVQIFLGRFGYGTGPFDGKLDDKTQGALKGYQRYVGLPATGEIDYQTLTKLTEDNKVLDQPLPYLPPFTFHGDQWERAIQLQGTWMHDGDPEDDALQTSKIVCFREQKQCLESTAVLFARMVPTMDVRTHVYAIKEWTDEQIVSVPYAGRPCTTSILRIHRQTKHVTRFTAYQQQEGPCANVKTHDVQFKLVSGQDVFTHLKQQKSAATQKILRVQ